MLSKISVGVGNKLISKFSTDYCQNTYRTKQIELCKKLDLIPSKCVIFGLAKNKGGYKKYNRGSKWRRVCLSKKIGNMGDLIE